MGKMILAAFVLLIVFNTLIIKNANAEDRVLIIPAHFWSDGVYRGVMYNYYPDALYSPYKGHVSCSIAARHLHSGQVAPAYSMCVHPSTFYRMRE